MKSGPPAAACRVDLCHALRAACDKRSLRSRASQFRAPKRSKGCEHIGWSGRHDSRYRAGRAAVRLRRPVSDAVRTRHQRRFAGGAGSRARRGAGGRRVPQAVAHSPRARTRRGGMGAAHGFATGYRRVAPCAPASSPCTAPEARRGRADPGGQRSGRRGTPARASRPCRHSTRVRRAAAAPQPRVQLRGAGGDARTQARLRRHPAAPGSTGVSQGVHQTPWPHMERLAPFGPITVLPTTWLIDRRGRLAAAHVGLVDRTALEAEIRQLLAE